MDELIGVLEIEMMWQYRTDRRTYRELSEVCKIRGFEEETRRAEEEESRRVIKAKL